MVGPTYNPRAAIKIGDRVVITSGISAFKGHYATVRDVIHDPNRRRDPIVSLSIDKDPVTKKAPTQKLKYRLSDVEGIIGRELKP